MPARTLDIDGTAWQVFPSGYITQSEHDEFGLIFVARRGENRILRVTRYSPVGTRSREQSLVELTDADLHRLFDASQPAFTSPEVGYAK